MRIAFIVVEFPILSQTFVLNQITGLIALGHEVDIYALKQSNYPKQHPDLDKYNLWEYTYYKQKPKNRIIRLVNGAGLLLAKEPKKILVLLRSLNVFKYGKQAASLDLFYSAIPFLHTAPYDIICCHFGWVGILGAILRELGAIQGKLVTTFHGIDITRNLQKHGDHVYDWLFDTGDLFLPISERWEQRLTELGCDKEKIIVHRMGIDCTRFCFLPRQPLANGRVRCVTISRLVEKKGVEYGIRAVAKLAKIYPDIEYNIIGDGDLKAGLQQLVRELNVGNVVKILGAKQQQEIVEVLKNSDILLAPSITARDGDQEGIPVVIMEAMAMGLPVVSTQHSGIPELVENGISGFLVPERDVNALVEKLSYLIEHPEIWFEMGKAGRAYVEEYYNIDKLNDRLVEIYQQLLNK
jgi:colanic acid/amylovoran biosynthesis glycosyltransferase